MYLFRHLITCNHHHLLFPITVVPRPVYVTEQNGSSEETAPPPVEYRNRSATDAAALADYRNRSATLPNRRHTVSFMMRIVYIFYDLSMFNPLRTTG